MGCPGPRWASVGPTCHFCDPQALVLINTSSLLLTLAGIFEILASVPLAMFLWMLCGQTKISTFEMLGLFLVLCIGAGEWRLQTNAHAPAPPLPCRRFV